MLPFPHRLGSLPVEGWLRNIHQICRTSSVSGNISVLVEEGQTDSGFVVQSQMSSAFSFAVSMAGCD